MCRLILVSLAFLAAAQLATSMDRCDEPDGFESRNCGWDNQDDCEDMNCCWNPNSEGPYDCYHPLDPCAFESNCYPGSTCTNVEPLGDGMFDCECPPNSNREDCRTRQGFCEIGPEDRVACGLVNHNPSDDFDGTPQEACERRGCCYNNETYDVKWCFHPSMGKRVVWV